MPCPILRATRRLSQVHGALCGRPPWGWREGFVEDGHHSGLVAAPGVEGGGGSGGGGGGGGSGGVVCHRPSALLRALGVVHVDLFVLDCEGCELDVISDVSAGGSVEVRSTESDPFQARSV